MIRTLERMVARLIQGLAVVSGLALLGIMLITNLNMFLRFSYGPILGVYDHVAWMGSIAMGFAVSYTQLRKSHVDMDIVFQLFPLRLRLILRSVVHLSGAVLFGLLTVWMYHHAQDLMMSGSSFGTLDWKEYPFAFVVTGGVAALVLVLFRDFVASLREWADFRN